MHPCLHRRANALVAAVSIVSAASAETITWTGAGGDSSWHSAANWDLGRVPIFGDDVVIPGPPSSVHVTYNAGNIGLNSLVCDGLLEIIPTEFPAPRVTLNGPSTIAGEYRVSGYSTFRVNAPVLITGLLHAHGVIDGSGSIEIATGGQMTTVNSSFVVPVTNHGTIEHQASTGFSGNGRLTNAADGTLLVRSGAIGSSPNPIENAGQCTVRGGAASTPITISGVLQNTGALRVERGILTMTANGSTPTPIQLDADATLIYPTSFTFPWPTPFSGPGTVRFQGGPFAFNEPLQFEQHIEINSCLVDFNAPTQFASLSVLSADSSTQGLGGAGDVTVTGHLQLEGNLLAGGSITLLPGATCTIGSIRRRLSRDFMNRGAIELSSPAYQMENAIWTNAVDGTIRITFTNTIETIAGTPRIINFGTIEWDHDSVHSVHPFLENHATLHVIDGNATVRGGFLHDGSIVIEPLETFQVVGDGVLLPAGQITGAGTFSMTVGTHHVESAIAPGIAVTVGGGGHTHFDADYSLSNLRLSETDTVLEGPGRLTLQNLNWRGGIARNAGGIVATTVTLLDTDRTPTLGTDLTVSQLFQVDDGAFRPMNMSDGRLTILPGATLRTNNNYGFLNQGGTNLVRNEGVWDLQENCSLGVLFENAGTVQLSTSTLTLGGGGENTGQVDVPAGSWLVYDGYYPHGSDNYPTGAGLIRFTGGAHLLPPGFPFGRIGEIESPAIVSVDHDAEFPQALLIDGGTLSGTGMRTFRSTLTWTSGTLAGPGTCVIAPEGTANASAARLRTRLENEGLLALLSGSNNFYDAQLVNRPGGIVTLYSSASLAVGIGANSFLNEGTLLRPPPTTSTATIAIPFTNTGIILSQAGSLSLSSTFSNAGVLSIATPSTITLSIAFSNYQNQVLTGGSYDINGRLRVPNIDVLTNNANVRLLAAAARFENTQSAAAFRNLTMNDVLGRIVLQNGATIATSATSFANAGEIEIGPGSSLSTAGGVVQTLGRLQIDGTLTAGPAQPVVVQGGELSGAGTIAAALDSRSMLAPGSPAGTLHVNGNAALAATGTLEIEIQPGSPVPVADRVSIAGTCTLAGTLRLRLRDGAQVAPGDEFEILTGTVSGVFATLDLPSLGGPCWTVSYGPTGVILRVVAIHPADLDGSGAVDLVDLTHLLSNFGQIGGAAHDDGDLDGNGDVDLADLTILLAGFGASCA